MQAAFNFDICARKHGGNPESVAANKRVDKSAGQREVYQILRIHGPLTCKEIAAKLCVEMHQISGRLTEMKAAGVIEPTGVIRDRGMVVRAL